MDKTKSRLWVIFCLAVTGLGVGTIWAFSHPNIRVTTAYYSKELCSCLFVEGLSEERCRVQVKELLPFPSVKIDSVRREIEVLNWFFSSRSRYYGDREGCRLVSRS